MFTKLHYLLRSALTQISLIIVLSIISIAVFTQCSPNNNKKETTSDDNKIIEAGGQQPEVNTPVKEPEKKAVEKAIELTDKDFYTTINEGVVLVDFWAAWCAPCRAMSPTIDELAKEMSDKATIAKLNVDHFNAISMQYDVRNIPTLIIFKNGKAEKRFLGIQTKEFLIQQIEQLL